MSILNKRKKQIWTIVTVALLVASAFGIYLFTNNSQLKFEKKDNKISLTTTDETTKVVGCTRTTRLENKPVYDRALSLIQEKYNKLHAA